MCPLIDDAVHSRVWHHDRGPVSVVSTLPHPASNVVLFTDRVLATHNRAVMAWRSGRGAEALRDLRGMAAERRGMASFLRGAVAESLGEDREAVTAFVAFRETFSRTRMWRSWCLPLSRVLPSRALERSGERQRAAAEVARLLTDWARADPDLPLLAEARTACRRLGYSVAAR